MLNNLNGVKKVAKMFGGIKKYAYLCGVKKKVGVRL